MRNVAPIIRGTHHHNSNDFTTIRYSQEVLFGDGFETGDTSDWSATVP